MVTRPAAKPAAAPASASTAAPASQPTASAPQPATAKVDVGAVLTEMAQMKGGGGNYQSSIVDLPKLLDPDSSLFAREELSVHAGADGSAEQNIALHTAVLDQPEANGGILPQSLRD